MSRSRPTLEIFLHLEDEQIDTDWLLTKAEEALPDCVLATGTESPLLPELERVEISLIDDATIAEVHREFMDDPSATDVITFHHGEILVSVDTARREGPNHGHDLNEETLLYIVHGLLHLNGHTDLSSPEREAMHRKQDSILQSLIR